MILSIRSSPGLTGLTLQPQCMSIWLFPVNSPYAMYGWRKKMNCHCIPGALRADPGKHRSVEKEPAVTSETRIHAGFIVTSSSGAIIVMRSKTVNVKHHIYYLPKRNKSLYSVIYESWCQFIHLCSQQRTVQARLRRHTSVWCLPRELQKLTRSETGTTNGKWDQNVTHH